LDQVTDKKKYVSIGGWGPLRDSSIIFKFRHKLSKVPSKVRMVERKARS